MILVVDANILISALIRARETRAILLNSGEELVSPDFMLFEIQEHKPEIIEKSGLDESQFEEVLARLKPRIKFFDEEVFLQFMGEADRISPDPDDVAYFALALCLGDAAIWSNDKGLKDQKRIRVYSTREIIESMPYKF